ncbi:PP2C family serine/threonine-protein phosphatase [Actinacidiphila sp. bgisy145]|uniref:PP2C family serine/threonine-protein phosphatase n=1 Tax=Actinacidiphila sp. bgisy145 TaxID=3413792 RepID=UPI003EB805C8
MTITTAVATRQGTGPNNADSTAVFRSEHGTVGAALVDIAGHDSGAPFVGRLCAETAARIAPQRGTLAALCTAGLLVADRGASADPEPNGVAVCARALPDGETRIAWVGDAHAYAAEGGRLTRLTTPHTWAHQAKTRWGVDIPALEDVLTTSLATATPATVLTVETTDPLVILASDGLDALTGDQVLGLTRRYGGDPQTLAEALVAAPEAGPDGYRDDTTVIIIANRPAP